VGGPNSNEETDTVVLEVCRYFVPPLSTPLVVKEKPAQREKRLREREGRSVDRTTVLVYGELDQFHRKNDCLYHSYSTERQ
jgi:hypothetical protein